MAKEKLVCDYHNVWAECYDLNLVPDPTAEAVVIGGGPQELAHTGNQVIDNNWIHDGGQVFHGGVGIWMTHSSFNQITHNEISDLDYSGISVGWQWSLAATSAHDNVIEYNHIHHLGRAVLSDMGGIYTLGSSPGTRIANNVIHDVYTYSYGGWGLYNDQGSELITMENNIVYNTKDEGFHAHRTRRNTLRNNIFAFPLDEGLLCSPHDDSAYYEGDEFYFTSEQNILYQSGKEMLAGTWANNAAYGIDSNIYWSTETTAPSFDGGTFAQWKARGHGLHSSIADPGFADPEGFDFSLGPGSPAVALGFNPIDADEAGLYGNAAWVQAPLGITRDPFNIPAGQGFGLSDGEDFESTAVGAEPDLGHAVPGGDPNLLSVTDAVAAAGAHSLKVADASGLGQTWYPYIYYTGDFLGGNIRLSFDLRLEPGAIFIAETRKYSGASYQAGPSPRVNSSGQLTSQGNVLISSLPYNQWIHFQIDYTLGPTSTGTYDLTVTPQGGSPQVFLGLGTDGHPREFSWLGFLSPGTTAHTFYLDNIKFEEL